MATEQLTRLVRLQIEAGQALRELAAIRRQTQGSNQQLGALAKSSRQATRELQGMGRGMATLGAQSRLATRELTSLNASVNSVSRSAGTLRTALAGAVGIYGIQELGSGLRGLVETYQKIQNQARLVTTAQDGVTASSARVRAEIEDLAGIAARSFGDIESTTNSYFRLSQIFRDLPQGIELAKTTTEALNKAFILSGATAREQTNAMYQLSQAFSSGTFNGDEFRSVAEQGVRIMTALQDQLRVTADGLVLFEEGMDELAGTTRVTIADLREFGAEGVLTTDLVIRAILREIPKLNEELKNVNITVDRAAALFRDRFALELGNLLDGPIASFSAGLRDLALNMTPLVDAVTRFGVALAALGAIAVAPAVAGLVASVTSLGGALRLAIVTFAALDDTGASEIFTGIAEGVKAAIEAARAAAAPFGGLEQVMKAVGLAAAGIVAVRLPAALGAMVLGAVAATREMGLLAAALTTVRRALIATGIGALVVALGLLVGEFVELRAEAGSTAQLLENMGLDSWAEAWRDVTKAVEDVIDSLGEYVAGLPPAGIIVQRLQKATSYAVEAMVNAFKGLGKAVEAVFRGMIGIVLLPFEAVGEALEGIYSGLSSLEGVPGLSGLGASMRRNAEELAATNKAIREIGREGAQEAGAAAAAFFAADAENSRRALEAIRNLGAELTEAEKATVAATKAMRDQAREAEAAEAAARRAVQLEKELAESKQIVTDEQKAAAAELEAFVSKLEVGVARQRSLIAAVKDGKAPVEALQAGFKLADEIAAATAEYEKLAKAAGLSEKEIATGRQNVANLVTTQAKAADILSGSLDELAEAEKAAAKAAKDGTPDIEGFWKELNAAREAALAGARASAVSEEAYENIKKTLANREELERAVAEFEKLAEAMNLPKTSQAYQDAVEDIGRIVGETQRARKAIEENLEKPAETAGTRLGRTFAEAFNSSFESIIGAVSESGSFVGGLRDLASTITGGLTGDLAKNLGDELKGLKASFKDLFSGFFDGQGQLFGLDSATLTGIGAGIGIGISGILSGNSQQIGAGIGTAAGAAIGSFIPVIGTSLGAALGGIFGGLASSLFGSKPSGSATAFTTGAQAGTVVYSGSGSLRQAGSSSAEAVAQVLGVVRDMFSVTTEGITRIVTSGLRGDNIDVGVFSGAKSLAEFGINKEAGVDFSETITALGEAMVQTGEITRRELKLINDVLTRTGDDPDAFARVIQAAYAFRDQIESAAREYVTGVDETATTYQEAYRNITATFTREATKDVRALGVTTRQIGQARRQARAELVEAYNFDVASQLVQTGNATREGIDAWFQLAQEQFQQSRQAAIATAKEIGGDVDLTRQLYAAQYQVLRDQYAEYLDELTNAAADAVAAARANFDDVLRTAIGSVLQSGQISLEALEKYRRLSAQEIRRNYEEQRALAEAAGAGSRELRILEEVLLDIPLQQLREEFRRLSYEIENAAAIARAEFEDVLRNALDGAVQTGDLSLEALSKWRRLTAQQIQRDYEEQRRLAVAAGATNGELAILQEVLLDLPMRELREEFRRLAEEIENAGAALRAEFEGVLLGAISGALQSGQADAAALAKFRELSSQQIRAEYEEARRAAVAAGATQAELALLRAYMLDLPLKELADDFNRFSDEISGVLDAIAEAESERADVLAELTRRANELRAAEEALADARRDLIVSDLAPGDERSQLAALRAQFDDLVSAGSGGDAQAAQDAARLAQALLQQGQAVYGSSALYGSLFKDVNTALAALESSVSISADRIETELTAESFDEITQRTTNQLLAALAQLDARLAALYEQSLSQSQSDAALSARNRTGVAA